MIDIHSHILPGIDDGSKNINMTLHMIKMAEKSGTKDIVATPHFCRGYGETHYDEVKNLVGEFNKLAKGEGLDINIHYGQEVYYSEQIIDDYKSGLIGTINNSRYMLIELPMLEFDINEVINNIYELQIRGITPIIAHPERYKIFIKKPSMINMLIKEGMLFQLNAGSITGAFGKDVKKTAAKYLENNIYSFIGSDAHRDRGRDTDMSEALKLLEKSQKRAFISNASAMLDDEEVAFNGTAVKEKKFLGLF